MKPNTPDPGPHPDEVAFVRAIAAAPADDAPRLVYADWLDEHAMPNRARLIRLALQIFPGVAATPVVPGRVLTELLEEYHVVWAGAQDEVRSHLPPDVWPFFHRSDGYHRGLLTEVRVLWNRIPGFVDAAGPLLRAAPVTSVSLLLPWEDEDTFRRLPITLLTRFLERPEVGQLWDLKVEDVFDQMSTVARLLTDCPHLSADAEVTVAATLPRAVREALARRFPRTG